MNPDPIYFEHPTDDYHWILAMNENGWYLVERVETLVSVLYGMGPIGPFSTN